MSAANEEKVLRVLKLFHSTSEASLNEALEFFADGAIYHTLVPTTKPLEGRAAIKAELMRQFGHYKECDCEILAMASSDRYVFTERRDHVTMLDHDKRIYSSVAAVFEFNADNKITSWREYWDSGDIARQLGLTSEQMNKLQEGTGA
ncbi:MAG: hypothetical protein JWM78_1278 [Verrucomicrobiaceae bacterium]|nr:hypothetical protein [Verrucomicrobiaceae bacterium]